jgi:hypothetical protein
MTHGVIGNTSDFGSAESWFEPRWVNRKSESGSGSEHITLSVLTLALTLALVCRWVNKKRRSKQCFCLMKSHRESFSRRNFPHYLNREAMITASEPFFIFIRHRLFIYLGNNGNTETSLFKPAPALFAFF